MVSKAKSSWNPISGPISKIKAEQFATSLVLLILHAPLDGLIGQKLGITFAVDDCIESNILKDTNCLFLHLVSAEVPVVYNYQPKAWTTRDIFSVGMMRYFFITTVEKDENENVHVSDKPNEGLSHSEAHSCHKATFKWMKLQKAAQLTLIRHIHDVAAQNKLSSFKQKLITDYIEYDSN
ncbi:hypothetical protein T02_3815 [Trichinella nativa]|uniref:Uncharacterized protein n=1 Tax=Trichinella nativa TaxID=6335 RepID=A0A0V1KQ00_9BILA|nr:hypothetical protein T02_3815 [Trichinella nativa]